MAKRQVHEMTIRPAKHPPGSFTSETRYKSSRGGQGGGPAYDYEGESGAHSSIDELHDHIDKIFDTESKDEAGEHGEKLNKTDRGGAESAKEED